MVANRSRENVAQDNKIRLYYLGGLVPHPGAKDKDGNVVGKASFIIRGNDRPYIVQNEFGAYIDVSNAEQANDILATHRIINKRGEFVAFTADPKLLNRLREQREKQKNAPVAEPKEEKKLTRAQLLKMLAETPEEEE